MILVVVLWTIYGFAYRRGEEYWNDYFLASGLAVAGLIAGAWLSIANGGPADYLNGPELIVLALVLILGHIVPIAIMVFGSRAIIDGFDSSKIKDEF